ncbi:hypothetical protein L1D28_23995 [Vibrio chagasii]|uniref:hypothetical protein n=1 Tax=Vibrio chagasii TaxID=170679 RepID=UPI001EFEE326|nr:hypothetical protein [Vibrio chagasii]MCG9564635.1 hypothetical protein [Vibrio chagasii]
MSKKYKNIDTYTSIIDVALVKASLSDIQSTELFAIRDSLISNVTNLSNVCFLPVSIAHRAVHQTEWVERLRRALKEGNLNGTKEERKIEIERRMERLNNNDVESWALSVLDEFVDDDEEVKNGFASLFNLAIINLWTIVETLSLDLWVTVVNEHHATLGKLAVNEKKDQISKTLTNILVENSFEVSLQDKIGSIAARSYDFTGVKDISKSYSVIFKTQRPQIENIFKNQHIVKLQAMRNVLVHNGGVMDEAYCRMVKDDSNLGQRIEINGKKFSELATNVFSLCTDLIKIVDEACTKSD